MAAKSKHALQYNVELLFGRGDVYFWTFTLPVKLHPVEGAKLWRGLLRELVRHLGFSGVRVFELHPSGHGLHVHVATNGWYDVNEVRAICRRCGWGRIHVEPFEGSDISAASGYLSKYLTKQTKVWQGMQLKGVRWWACFGRLSDKVRVKDVMLFNLRRAIWDLLPSWVVCNCMSVADYEGAKGRGLSEREKRELASAKESFLNYHANGKHIGFKVRFGVSLARRFNFVKMWLVNQIYNDNTSVMGCFSGVREKWGMRARALGFDFGELRRGALFISGCEVTSDTSIRGNFLACWAGDTPESSHLVGLLAS